MVKVKITALFLFNRKINEIIAENPQIGKYIILNIISFEIKIFKSFLTAPPDNGSLFG